MGQSTIVAHVDSTDDMLALSAKPMNLSWMSLCCIPLAWMSMQLMITINEVCDLHPVVMAATLFTHCLAAAALAVGKRRLLLAPAIAAAIVTMATPETCPELISVMCLQLILPYILLAVPALMPQLKYVRA